MNQLLCYLFLKFNIFMIFNQNDELNYFSTKNLAMFLLGVAINFLPLSIFASICYSHHTQTMNTNSKKTQAVIVNT